MLWLAQFVEPGRGDQKNPPGNASEQDDRGVASTVETGGVASDDDLGGDADGEDGLDLYADSAGTGSDEEPDTNRDNQQRQAPQGMPFSVPAAPAIRTRLDLARSLRPLMRKVPSRTRFDLDEEATVTRIAETQVWMPEVHARPERWLELDLVVEDAKSTVIWERAIAELVHLAEYQGAFRAVRTWRLRVEGTEVQLLPRWSLGGQDGMQRPRSPRELTDPTGRRLIWLVSDCTSALWRDGIIYETLAGWSQKQPLAIVQLFPEQLWSRTALRDGYIVKLESLPSGLPSARLGVEGLPRRLERRRGVGLVTVPVVTLDAGAMRRWARVLSGAGDLRTPGRTFDVEAIHQRVEKAPSDRGASLTARERVALFRSASSETAQQLANLMAAAPVSLPVIDLLRDAFRHDFVEEVQQSHVAEVLLSGLLRRCDGEDECHYEFWEDAPAEGGERVRDLLLGDASIAQTMTVLNVLSESICQKLHSPVKSFRALLAELPAEGELREAVLPFARVGLDVLRRLGGEYATFAERHDPTFGSKPPIKPVELQDFEELEFETAEFVDTPVVEEFEYKTAWIADVLERVEFETARVEWEKEVTRQGLFGFGRQTERRWVTRRSRGTVWGYAETLAATVLLELVAIPGGSFLMGAPESELESVDNERPQHRVEVPEFYLGRYQVTQEQWNVVASWEPVERELNPDPAMFKGNRRPVEQVSWEDAKEFCQRLSRATERTYRLPSEAEWEYACRAGTKTPFHFGETLTSELANYRATDTYGNGPKGQYRGETTEVGSFPANVFGLHDMHGNVWEWCEDDWHKSYEGAPKDGKPWLESDPAVTKLLRGGSWGYSPRICRSARRNDGRRDARSYFIGFRVCCEPPRTPALGT